MDSEGQGILGNPQATGEQVRQAWERAAMAAMENHRRTGVPVATWDWEHAQVALIPADDASINDEHAVVDGISTNKRS
jgi:hypothetical protein